MREPLSVMNMRMILISVLSVFLTGCAVTFNPESADTRTEEQRRYWACESLGSTDPTIARQGIALLFSVGGLEAYTVLHLQWIAEPNPEIRKYILEGFSKIGDHRHIADSSFPREWVRASRRFSSPEKETRLRELKEYFPQEMKD